MATKKTTRAKKVPAEGAKIEWRIPQSLPSYFVTNIVVQNNEDAFSLSFFEAKPPILLGTPEEIEAQRAQTTSVDADCVARVVVSPRKMREFVEVLNRSLRLHDEKYGASVKEEG